MEKDQTAECETKWEEARIWLIIKRGLIKTAKRRRLDLMVIDQEPKAITFSIVTDITTSFLFTRAVSKDSPESDQE